MMSVSGSAHVFRRLAVLVAVMLSAGCAARVAPALRADPPVPPAAAVDALVGQGCYRCLASAHEAASAAGLQDKAYEAAILLAARSKELGLDPGPWLSQAHAALPPGPEWALHLDIVEALQVDPLSGDRDVLLTEEVSRRRLPDVYERWRQALAIGPGSPVVRAYLDMSIACRRQQTRGREEAIATALAPLGDVPLLRYRAALCGGEDAPPRLTAVREADAEFVDADLELGRFAVQSQVQPDFEEGLRRLQSARAAFPASPVIPSVVAALHEAREEWPEALETYDAVLALVPTHRDALLGRTVSLSQLSRYQEGVESASRLIELGSWFLGEAHYWRAWNEFQLKQIAAARADVDRAKTLMPNASTHVLSGLIAWTEKRLEPAEEEFQRALDMDFGQCDAAFYLGGVRVEQRRWPESLAAFQHSQQCFALSIVVRREAVAKLSATDASAAANAREIVSHERAIVDSEKRRAESAQNVAAIEKFLQSN